MKLKEFGCQGAHVCVPLRPHIRQKVTRKKASRYILHLCQMLKVCSHITKFSPILYLKISARYLASYCLALYQW